MLKLTKLSTVVWAILSVILGFELTAAPYYVKDGVCTFDMGFFITSIYVMIILFFTGSVLQKLMLKANNSNLNAVSKIIKVMLDNKYSLLIFTILIFILWLPLLIALYPGTLINDTWGQLTQYVDFYKGGMLNKYVLSDHHPFIDTFYIGGIIVNIADKLNNWHFAFFTYVLLQALFTAFSFSGTIIYSYKKLELNVNILLGVLAFYVLCPVYVASVQTISKDALFSWIYVLFMILIVEAIRTNGQSFFSYKYVLELILITTLTGLTKKVGIYVVLLTLLALVIFLRNKKITSFIVLITTGVLLTSVTGIIKNSLGVIPGGDQEMYSLLFQQTARYAKEYGNETTKNEKKAIEKMIDLKYTDLPKVYDPTNADPVKGYRDRQFKKEDRDRYLKVWFNQGVKHPKVYFAATNSMLAGWYSMSEYKPLMDMSWHSQLNTKILPEKESKRTGIFEKTASAISKWYDGLYDNRLTSLIFTYAFFASIVPFYVFSTLWKNLKRKYWLLTIPTILSIGLGCYLAPIATFEGIRYLYPLVYTLPFLILVSFKNIQ